MHQHLFFFLFLSCFYFLPIDNSAPELRSDERGGSEKEKKSLENETEKCVFVVVVCASRYV